MNSSPWRLEGVDGGDEQYLVESRFAGRHTPPDEQDPHFDRSAPNKSVSSVLRYATPLPINRTPVSTVALQHKSVSSILRYATSLPINRTPVSTVGGPFPPFCDMPDPSRSTRPRSKCRRSASSVVPYARPHFHRMFCPSPPDEHDHAFCSNPAGWLPRVPLPPDEHDAVRCHPMTTTHSVASP